MSGFFDGGFGGVASGVGSLVSSLFAGSQIRKTVKAQKELADYQFKLNQQQWNAENAYNTPAEQMKRLQEAGLNPNLVYGNGTVSGNTTTSGPRYDAPKVDYRQNVENAVANGLNMLMALKMNKSQLNNMEKQGSVLDEEAESKKIANNIQRTYGMQQASAALANLEAQRQSILASRDFTNAQKEAALFRLKVDQQFYENERATALAQSQFNLQRDQSFFGYDLEAKLLANKFRAEEIQNAVQSRNESKARVSRMAVQNALDDERKKLIHSQEKTNNFENWMRANYGIPDFRSIPSLFKSVSLLRGARGDMPMKFGRFFH